MTSSSLLEAFKKTSNKLTSHKLLGRTNWLHLPHKTGMLSGLLSQMSNSGCISPPISCLGFYVPQYWTENPIRAGGLSRRLLSSHFWESNWLKDWWTNSDKTIHSLRQTCTQHFMYRFLSRFWLLVKVDWFNQLCLASKLLNFRTEWC